jgi:hypothetical protein
VTPEIEKPAPVTVAELMVTGPVPVEVSVIVCVVEALTETLPKLTVEVLTPSVGTAAFNVKMNVCETPARAAVKVTVCAVDTEATVAEKLAVVAPAATVTEAGTVTAALLLVRFMANPPLPAAAFIVMVHASVPAPVMEEFAQDNPVREGTPVPLSATVVEDPEEELLVNVS